MWYISQRYLSEYDDLSENRASEKGCYGDVSPQKSIYSKRIEFVDFNTFLVMMIKPDKEVSD